MPEILQTMSSPQLPSPEVVLCAPAVAAPPRMVGTAAWMLGPPYAVASQLVWAGQPLAAALLTGLLAVVTFAWFWRVRPGRGR